MEIRITILSTMGWSGKTMTTLNVSKRRVVTLPKELLEHVAVQPGEKIELTLLPDGQGGLSAVRPKGEIEVSSAAYLAK
jgi:antitoxin component of MazEF toxin-antitoxin module